jgi:segregation and condensation protein A
MFHETAYTIQLPVYEGPLDLLLDLIERAELDVTAVALAQVTGQYLDYLRQMPEHSLGDLAAFLVIAARLLQIKSEALLPRPPLRQPGEEDPADALARQLIAYKRYKQVAVLLAEREAAGLRTYVRVAPPPAREPKLDLAGLTVSDLAWAMREALASRPSGASLGTVVALPRVRIRDKILQILEALRQKGRTTFRRLLRRARSRLEIVVSFLAILELVKRRQLEAEQAEPFGDIELVPGSDWRPDQDVELDLEFEE